METLLRFYIFWCGTARPHSELPLRVALAYRECMYRGMPGTANGSK